MKSHESHIVKFFVIQDSLPALGEEMGRHAMWDRRQEKRLISPGTRLCDEEGEDAEGWSRQET